MMHSWLPLVLALGWILLPQEASAKAAATRIAADQSPSLAEVVEHLISRTNAFRHQEGRPAVAPNPQLTATAQDFASYMAHTGQFSHTADGQTPQARAQARGYDACLIAENIAYQHHPARLTAEALAQGLFEGWQHSPDHRHNLLDPGVTETGMGVAQSQHNRAYYAVQLFGRPSSQRIEFQVTNATDLVIQYLIDGQTLSLPPQATHTHQQCRPPAVTFHGLGTQEQKTVNPSHGVRYTVMPGDAGTFRLESK